MSGTAESPQRSLRALAVATKDFWPLATERAEARIYPG